MVQLHALGEKYFFDLPDLFIFVDCYYSELIHFGSSVEHVQRSDLKAQCRMY